MEGYRRINYRALLLFMLKRAWIIALVVLLFAAGAFYVSKLLITPEYKATIRLYVNNRIEASSSLTSSDVSASKSLVDTYITIISSDSVIDVISEKTGGKYTGTQIKNMLSAKSINGTEVFAVSITGPVPEDCAAVANAIADFAPDKISEIVDGSSVKIVDRAKIPTVPISPSVERNVAGAVIIGVALILILFFLMFISDTTIYSESDVREFCTLPILGIMPDFTQAGQGKYSYSYGRAGRSGK